MDRFPFTPVGVQEKQDELYALSDLDLAMQAASVQADFKQWIFDNFMLNPEEQSFVNNLAIEAAVEFGKVCNTAFLYRLPITLVPGQPIPGSSKRVISDNTFKVIATTAMDDITVSGVLTFTISYI